MNELRLELAGGQTRFTPGERIHGTASWRQPESPDGLEVRLFWYTAGKGDRDIGIVERRALDPGSPEGSLEFSFEAPRAPLSFSGKLISLLWAIELVALPGGEAGRQEITISHTGEEIRIGSPGSAGFGADEMEPA